MEIVLKPGIAAIVHRYHRPPDVYDIVKCTEEFGDYLDRKLEKPVDSPLEDKDVESDYDSVRQFLFATGSFTSWEAILIRGWMKLNEIQRKEKRYIYKGYIGIWLSDLYRMHSHDQGAATRWALLTQATDALKDHKNGGAAQVLQALLGMSKPAFNAFNKVVDECQEESKNKGWNWVSAFPEYIVLRYCLRHPEYSYLFARSSNMLEFPLNHVYLQTLLEANLDDKSGKQLEDLSSYLFTLIPGWIPSRNRQDHKQTFEHDIVVSNLKSVGNLEAELFGRHFLVECKNWQNKVGSNQIGYFLYRMHLTHCHFGIIFATKGITGTKISSNGKIIGDKDDKKAAKNLIEKAFHEDHLICIVIDQNDLNRLVQGQASFWSMLLEKTNELRFGAAKSSHLK